MGAFLKGSWLDLSAHWIRSHFQSLLLPPTSVYTYVQGGRKSLATKLFVVKQLQLGWPNSIFSKVSFLEHPVLEKAGLSRAKERTHFRRKGGTSLLLSLSPLSLLSLSSLSPHSLLSLSSLSPLSLLSLSSLSPSLSLLSPSLPPSFSFLLKPSLWGSSFACEHNFLRKRKRKEKGGLDIETREVRKRERGALRHSLHNFSESAKTGRPPILSRKIFHVEHFERVRLYWCCWSFLWLYSFCLSFSFAAVFKQNLTKRRHFCCTAHREQREWRRDESLGRRKKYVHSVKGKYFHFSFPALIFLANKKGFFSKMLEWHFYFKITLLPTSMSPIVPK